MKILLLSALATPLFFGACALDHGSHPGTYIHSSTASTKGLVTHIHTPNGAAVVASPEGRVGTMKGVAIRHSILLGLVSWGSTGVGEAAQKAAPEFRYRNSPHEGLRTVDTVATGGVKILWGIIYCNEQTIVTGEAEAPAHSGKEIYSK